MKHMVLAIAVSVLVPVMANAQTSSPVAAPAPLNADSPIETLYATPAGKAALTKHLPDLDKHPSYEQFKGMSLRQVAPFSDGKITEDVIKTIDVELKRSK